MESMKLSLRFIPGGKPNFQNMWWIRGAELLEESEIKCSITSPNWQAIMNVEKYQVLCDSLANTRV